MLGLDLHRFSRLLQLNNCKPQAVTHNQVLLHETSLHAMSAPRNTPSIHFLDARFFSQDEAVTMRESVVRLPSHGKFCLARTGQHRVCHDDLSYHRRCTRMNESRGTERGEGRTREAAALFGLA
jgi:hypothetical protein